MTTYLALGGDARGRRQIEGEQVRVDGVIVSVELLDLAHDLVLIAGGELLKECLGHCVGEDCT